LTVFGWRNNKGCDGFSQGIRGSGDAYEAIGLVENKNIHTIDALKNGSMIIMGFLGKIGNAIQKIDYHISNDPEIVGKRFEDHVEKLFSTKYFKIVEKNHSCKTNTER
jgi:hypothetical protein